MKITPLEIRQKSFEKTFRGYDKEEVDAYLQSLSQEWERVQDERKELKIKLENSEREVEKLREVENSLFKTLKTAEDTGASMIDQANKAAELHLRETQMKAEALMSEAKSKAKATLEEAEMKARAAMEEVEEELKTMSAVFKTLQNGRDDFLGSLRSLSNELLEKVERAGKQARNYEIEEHLNKARDFKIDLKLTSRNLEMSESENQQIVEDEPPKAPAPAVELESEPEAIENQVEEEEPRKQEKDSGSGSFFDEIE